MTTHKDIESRDDIELLVDEFYLKVVKDEVIGHFFNKVVKVDWVKHKPNMCDFWETMILGNMIYQGNPMLKHIDLAKKSPLEKEHFDRWHLLWNETVKGLFSGKNADKAIEHASNIGMFMYHKTKEVTNSNLSKK